MFMPTKPLQTLSEDEVMICVMIRLIPKMHLCVCLRCEHTGCYPGFPLCCPMCGYGR